MHLLHCGIASCLKSRERKEKQSQGDFRMDNFLQAYFTMFLQNKLYGIKLARSSSFVFKNKVLGEPGELARLNSDHGN